MPRFPSGLSRGKQSQVNGCLSITDLQGSVISVLKNAFIYQHIYTPYGHLSSRSPLSSRLAFNGERFDPSSGHYLLGRGYRAFNPILMRFNSADSLCPFGRGGLNGYAAFNGNPIGITDPDGHSPVPITITLLKAISRFKLGLKSRSQANAWTAVDDAVATAPVLRNAHFLAAANDIKSLKMRPTLPAFRVKTIMNRSDVDAVGGRAQKYIFTKNKELIVGRLDSGHFSHPILENFAARGPKVIAAGYIVRGHDGIIVSAHTGHYYESARGRDTTGPVILFLQRMGVDVRRIRDDEMKQ